MYDLAFLILSTCLHIGDTNFYWSKQCQQQLTVCHDKLRTKYKDASTDAIIGYCLVHEIDYDVKQK